MPAADKPASPSKPEKVTVSKRGDFVATNLAQATAEPASKTTKPAPAPAEMTKSADPPQKQPETPVALRFDFAEEELTTSPQTAQKSAKKLATVSSVTKSQAGAAKKKD